MTFPKLFSPGKIGKMELSNRLIMAPVSTRLASEEGAVSDKMIDFYRERAKGGVGLIILENTCVDFPKGKGPQPFLLCCDHDRYLPGLSELSEELHRFGAKVATQLQHVGRQTTKYWSGGLGPVGPSPEAGPGCDQPHVLSVEEIEGVVDLFVSAAWRSRIAGFDAIELHGAHGYLFTQFLSPFINHRTDKYGGAFKNRIRFPVQVVKAVRAKVGSDFPIIYRFSADEHIKGGLPIEEVIEFSRCLEKAGVDALDITAGIYEAREWIFPPMHISRGYNRKLAAVIKAAVNIPVSVVGRINNPQLAEEILQANEADFVSLGRPLLADPNFPKKAANNLEDQIRPCIACNQCVNNPMRVRRVRCAVNPSTGRERLYKPKKAARAKQVHIIGGGPAGLQAAIVAAECGHKVTLYEKSDCLGGQLLAASAPSFKFEIKHFLDYLKRQVHNAKISIQVGVEVTPELIINEASDVIVIATGAIPIVPNVPGMNEYKIITAIDVLNGQAKVGDKVIIIGGGESGIDTAIFLGMSGREVTIIEKLANGLFEVDLSTRAVLEQLILDNNVKVLNNHRLLSINTDGIIASCPNGKIEFSADSIVLAAGMTPERSLFNSLKNVASKIIPVGDCITPGTLYEAISSASNAMIEV